MTLSLHFDKGTIQLHGMADRYLQHLDGIYWDERTNSYRTPAANYRKLVTALSERNISFQDHARKYSVDSLFVKKGCHVDFNTENPQSI